MATIEDFYFRVEIELRLSRAEVEHLRKCSERHYDSKCRAASKHGGFIYGWRNRFIFGDDDPILCRDMPDQVDLKEWITVRVAWQQIDTCCKILENEHYDKDGLRLLIVFRRIIQAMRAQHDRLNGPPDVEPFNKVLCSNCDLSDEYTDEDRKTGLICPQCAETMPVAPTCLRCWNQDPKGCEHCQPEHSAG